MPFCRQNFKTASSIEVTSSLGDTGLNMVPPKRVENQRVESSHSAYQKSLFSIFYSLFPYVKRKFSPQYRDERRAHAVPLCFLPAPHLLQGLYPKGYQQDRHLL